jgi:GNAT superfamily N-acetyltransferase
MAPSPTLIVKHLDGSHLRQGFDCGNSRLNAYIQHLASQHERRHIGRTYVLLRDPEPTVLGFYTLAASSVAFAHMPENEGLPRYPVPVVKLAQLAVDRSMQGQGWGRYLLLDALSRCERISRDIAVYAVELDAIDNTARTFYQQFSFTCLNDDPNHLYCTMKKIAQLRLNST